MDSRGLSGKTDEILFPLPRQFITKGEDEPIPIRNSRLSWLFCNVICIPIMTDRQDKNESSEEVTDRELYVPPVVVSHRLSKKKITQG